MVTVVLKADEQVLEKARQVAEQQHTTLDRVFSAALEQYMQQPLPADWESAREKLRHPFVDEPEGCFTREELNYRPSKWLAKVEAREAEQGKGNTFLKAMREGGPYYVHRPLSRDEMNER